MTIPGMTVSAAPAATSKSPVGATASGAAAVFGQSLQLLMGAVGTDSSGGETAETPSNPLLAALQQLIAAAGVSSEEVQNGTPGDNVKQLEAKLEELLGQLDVIDEQLLENPQLVSMLQNWVQQAQVLLNGQQSEPQLQEGQQQSANAVEMLASNPSTLKFALQDIVAQLVELQKTAQTAPELKVQAQQALAALEQTVQMADENISQTAAKQPIQQVVQTEVVQDEKQLAAKTLVKAEDQPTIAAAKNQSQQSGSGMQQDSDSSQEQQQDIKPQGTITAGELALRANGLTPAKPVEAVPVNQMAKEVEKLVVDRLQILQKQGFTEAKITMTPEHLGKVDIRITMHAGQLVAHFITEHAAAKDLLEQQMVQLRGSLQGQGLTVERLEVTQSSSLQSQMDHNGGQGGSGQQQGKRSRSKEESSDDARLTAELGEELGEWLRQKTAAQSGSSFIAEA
ncbi:flagellar hook-length control protein FliK [Saccharibacillus kuerlensis]|nr:flagellar hook-length control protein FliK [Saccharibacillus kuerlensis]